MREINEDGTRGSLLFENEVVDLFHDVTPKRSNIALTSFPLRKVDTECHRIVRKQWN